jgi:dihydrodipicolinate synthase/N-acetylneuraminate lyase
VNGVFAAVATPMRDDLAVDRRAVAQHSRRLLDAGCHDIPPQTVLGFSPELIGRLLDAYPGTIAGTKDSAGDAARIERICTDFPQLTVFAGPRRSCSTPCAGAATAASRRRSTSRRARPARSTTASSPARTPGPPRPR